MESWTGLDKDVYVPLDLVRADGVSCDSWPAELATHATRPTAVLARQVATPNYELLWFLRVARRHGFRPLVIEHATDRFTVHNGAKRALVSLPIVTGRSRQGQPIVRRQTLLDPMASQGVRLDEIVTDAGERLLDYHHRKLREMLGSEMPEIMDLSDIMPPAALRPSRYYFEFFRMLRGNLVLFEDFVVDEPTADFFRSTVRPAWEKVVEATGRRPQILRLSPERKASSPLWSAYPSEVADDPSWIRRTATRERSGLLAA